MAAGRQRGPADSSGQHEREGQQLVDRHGDSSWKEHHFGIGVVAEEVDRETCQPQEDEQCAEHRAVAERLESRISAAKPPKPASEA